jgi:hypothetical protein
MPGAGGMRGNHPIIKAAVAYLPDFVRLPIAHIEGMGNDARAGPEFAQQLGPKLQIQFVQQIKSDHGGLPEVHCEEIALDEFDPRRNVGLPGIFPAFPNTSGVDVHAHASGAELLGGRDDNAAVPTAEVVNDIIFGNPRLLEHGLDNVHRSGLEVDIGFPDLGAAGMGRTA